MDTSTTLRRRPTQARSLKTFNHILTTAAKLLAEVGFDAFNTNLLAARAGVGPRAIYRYFPNKHALVAELARELSSECYSKLTLVTETASEEWPELWCRYLETYVDAVRESSGGAAILQTMRLHPELRAIEEEINQQYILDISHELRRANADLGRAQARSVALTLMSSTVAVIDAALEEKPAASSRMIEMLKTMHLAFLRETLH